MKAWVVSTDALLPSLFAEARGDGIESIERVSSVED